MINSTIILFTRYVSKPHLLSQVRCVASQALPQLSSEKYNVKRKDFGVVQTSDIEFFKSTLSDERVLTDENEVLPFNIDWIKNCRENENISSKNRKKTLKPRNSRAKRDQEKSIDKSGTDAEFPKHTLDDATHHSPENVSDSALNDNSGENSKNYENFKTLRPRNHLSRRNQKKSEDEIGTNADLSKVTSNVNSENGYFSASVMCNPTITSESNTLAYSFNLISNDLETTCDPENTFISPSNIHLVTTENHTITSETCSFIENSDLSSNLLETARGPENMYVPPSGSEQSYQITDNHTITSETRSFIETSDMSSNLLETARGLKNIYVPPSDSEQSNQITDNHTITSETHSFIETFDMSSNLLETARGPKNIYVPPSDSEQSNQIIDNHTITSETQSFIETFDMSSNLLETARGPKNIYVPPSDSEQSNQITDNHTITSETQSFIETSDMSSNLLETARGPENMYVPPSDSEQSYQITDNYTITSETHSFIENSDLTLERTFSRANVNIPPSDTKYSNQITNNHKIIFEKYLSENLVPESSITDHINDSSSSSEFDDSDRDATFNPPSESAQSSNYSSDEELYDKLSNVASQDEDYTAAIKTGEKEIVDFLYNADIQRPRQRRCNDKKNTADTTGAVNYKTTRIRTKDYCFFCETDVLNFARHVIRHHAMESEVQQILSYPKKSKTRKNLFTSLRKKGNYVMNLSKCKKPMKKSNLYPNIDYLPCEKCLGFYSRKQLWKHKKTCQQGVETSNAQINSQNFMLRTLPVDKKLKEEVFPKMRPDRISLEAKKDPLICAFGAQYLRIHREKHFINVTSRKMRELSKLLIELRTLKSSIKSLTDALKPQHYDSIVTATKKVSSYDDKKDSYGAPTYAMNISTSLKQCCNIAINIALKSDSSVNTAMIEADLNTLIKLIEANWKFDVSSQACNDLNLKKWNKVSVVPLANDLKLLKKYLSDKAKTAASKLVEEKPDVEAYNLLMETVYCRMILLNRRRPGELQRLFLSTYQESNNDKNVYEEFDSAISQNERMLLKNFKRIVIRGKRGRGVPVLISEDVQSDTDLLISVRSKYIKENNNYLFAKPGCETALCGYKVLEKHAKASGAKNPKAITTTKLRKHLATLTQMLNLKDGDIEQLANFMGHTQAVHRQNYRLPDDVYQTAKISKLLLLMESGNAAKYKGQSLDDIELEKLNEDILLQEGEETTDHVEEILEYDTEQPSVSTANVTNNRNSELPLSDVTNDPIVTNVRDGKKKRNLVPWTSQQKQIVLKFFSKHIKSRKPPKRQECEELIGKHPDILHNKNWLKIKVFVQNTYTKK